MALTAVTVAATMATTTALAAEQRRQANRTGSGLTQVNPRRGRAAAKRLAAAAAPAALAAVDAALHLVPAIEIDGGRDAEVIACSRCPDLNSEWCPFAI